MNFVPEAIQHYAEQHSESEPALLRELARETNLKMLHPRMLTGHLLGRFYSQISRMLRPARILEVGTYTGYSALCFAEGLKPNGRIFTLEIDPEVAEFAASFFQRSPYKDRIELVIGDACAEITKLDGPFDLVFLDAAKEQYLDYYELALARMPSGGVILADNVLWSGQVVDNSFTDEATEALRRFNTFVCNDARVENLLLPLRDGVHLIRKR